MAQIPDSAPGIEPTAEVDADQPIPVDQEPRTQADAPRSGEDGSLTEATSGAQDKEAAPFAPLEPLDGRLKGEWRTRFTDPTARRQIQMECTCLVLLILGTGAIIAAIALNWPRPFIGLSSDRWNELAPFAYGWTGGALGGALFSAKWLIHTVGRGTWNQDRLAWRLFTPLLGGGAGFLVVSLSISRVIPLFDSDLVNTGAGATGIGMLVGFFADRTFSRLEGFAASHLEPSKKNTTPERT